MRHFQAVFIHYRDTRVPKSRLAALLAAALSLQCGNTSEAPADSVVSAKEAIAGAATFGVGCQNDFQNNWTGQTLTYAWNNCWNFWNEANYSMTGMWAYNLHGARDWWQQPSFYHDNVNSVEFFYSETHGGLDSTSAYYAMWDSNIVAWTNQMPLTLTEGFFTYACDTHVNDGNLVARWAVPFQAGLRVATGAWNTLTDNWWTSSCGTDFMQDMENSLPFFAAWEYGTTSWTCQQHPSTIVSGTGPDGSDCLNRLNNMTIRNRLTNFQKYTGSQVTYLCWSQVTE